MNWIFDNLQIVIVVGSTIAWWLTQRKSGNEEAPPPTDRPGRPKIDIEERERNRRLREEIRRKREQRRNGETVKEASPPPPLARPEPRANREDIERIPPILREMMGIPDPEPPPAPIPPPVPETTPVQARQKRMEAEIAELESKRRRADLVTKRTRAGAVSRQPQRRARGGSDGFSDRDFLATLRDPRHARRAIVLREILGKPIALR